MNSVQIAYGVLTAVFVLAVIYTIVATRNPPRK